MFQCLLLFDMRQSMVVHHILDYRSQIVDPAALFYLHQLVYFLFDLFEMQISWQFVQTMVE